LTFNYIFNQSICSNTPFFVLRYFSLFKLKVFSNRLLLVLSFLPFNVSHSKSLPLFSFLPFQFYSLPRNLIFLLIRFFIYILYIKPLVSINKQFSSDSFLGWAGHLWDFHLSDISLNLSLLVISAFGSTPSNAPYLLKVIFS